MFRSGGRGFEVRFRHAFTDIISRDRLTLAGEIVTDMMLRLGSESDPNLGLESPNYFVGSPDD